MLREMHEEGIHSQQDAKNFLGNTFRTTFLELPSWKTNIEVAEYLIEETILIHLDSYMDKCNMLAFMMQKLYSAAQNKCKVRVNLFSKHSKSNFSSCRQRASIVS
jgi:DNA-directed RNA polymerase I subunit RPA2